MHCRSSLSGLTARVWLAVVVLMSVLTPARATTPLDTRTLPRLEGATEPFKPTAELTIYDLPAPAVQARATAVLERLGQDGWVRYVHPNVRTTTGESVVIATLKKGSHSVRIVVAHATRDALATRITYEARRIQHDLPFPAGAEEIAFEPEKPQLYAFVTAPPEEARAAVTRDLQADGWAIVPGARGGMAFKKDGVPPIGLVVSRANDGRTRIAINPLEGAAARVASGLPAKAAADPDDDADLNALLGQARKAIADAQRSGGGQPRPVPADPSSPPGAALKAGGDTGGAPIPVPDGATSVTFDAERGRLEFRSEAPVASLAAFYRTEMRRLGWSEERSVINSEKMVSLDFKKGQGRVSFTIMAWSNGGTRISASGRGLVTAAPAVVRPTPAAPAPASSPVATPSEVVEQIPGDRLVVSDQRGLVVPAPHLNAGSERTPYRQEASAAVAASITDIVAFYDRELQTRVWTETPGSRSVTAERAEIRYAQPEGSGLLTLLRPSGGVTEVRLLTRRDAKAKADGVAPKPGSSMLVLSNMEDAPVEVTVQGRTVRVGGGVGAQAADGPKLDLPPGEHRLTIRMGKQPPRTETMTLVAGQTMGAILGARRVLIVPLY